MKKGFTLIELAIVMVVIGLLVGGSIQMMSVMSKRAKVTEAKQQLETLREGILGFVQTNGALPTQNEFETLGDITDPWGRHIDYYPDANLTQNDLLCIDDDTYDTLNTPAAPPSLSPINDIGFILVSSGANYNMQTDMMTERKLYAQGIDNVDDNTTDMSRNEEYDDLFIVVTLAELKALGNCQSKILQIINPTLPTGTVGTAYPSTSIIATGNNGTLTYSTPANCPAGMSCSGGSITGTSTASGSFPLTFTATDSIGATATRQLVLVINADPNAGGTGTGTNNNNNAGNNNGNNGRNNNGRNNNGNNNRDGNNNGNNGRGN